MLEASNSIIFSLYHIKSSFILKTSTRRRKRKKKKRKRGYLRVYGGCIYKKVCGNVILEGIMDGGTRARHIK
jgi:hypothetical protein